MEYAVKLKGHVLFKGSVEECFAHLCYSVGDAPMKVVYDAGYRIEGLES